LHYAKISAPARPDPMTRSDTSSDAPRAGALADLHRAIQALRPHLLTADDRADLMVIEEAIGRLSQPSTPTANGISDFDPTRLAHLLQITGPDLAPELLARLTEDLTTTQDSLTAGDETADWKRLREASHVLISLSGSVGALSLQAMSESLNAIAHTQDRDALSAIMPPLSSELSALIRLIRATRAPNGGAA
jgi:HPt (histidine-containing phosphotransfer) domain-containing protein